MRIVARWHRRHPDMTGAMWAIGVFDGGAPVGVATVGRPSRQMQVGAERLAVTRVAVDNLPRVIDLQNREHANSACSMLYGACARAARQMGAVDLLTYTHLDEPGISLRGAGWVEDVHVTKDESGDRPSRPRKNAASSKSGPKRRWWAPWSAYVNTAEFRAAKARAA